MYDRLMHTSCVRLLENMINETGILIPIFEMLSFVNRLLDIGDTLTLKRIYGLLSSLSYAHKAKHIDSNLLMRQIIVYCILLLNNVFIRVIS